MNIEGAIRVLATYRPTFDRLPKPAVEAIDALIAHHTAEHKSLGNVMEDEMCRLYGEEGWR